MEKLLSDFTIGEQGVVKSVAGDGRIRRRLFDMGVTPGAEVYLRKKAPLGRSARSDRSRIRIVLAQERSVCGFDGG